MILKRLFFVVLVLFFIACTPKLAIQFEVAKQLNSVTGYQAFLNENSNSMYSDEILDRLELAVINQALQDKDEQQLNDFVKKYPNSLYIKNVLKLREDIIVAKVFDEVKKEDTLSGYSSFIQKYEGYDLVKDAEKLYYTKYLETQGADFKVEKYPLKPKKQQTAPDIFSQKIPQKKIDDPSLQNAIGNNVVVGRISDNNYPLPSERIENTVGKIIVGQTKTKIKKTIPQKSLRKSNPLFHNSVKDFSDLIDDSDILLKTNPENLLYGKIFKPATSPRIVQPDFTFFVQTLQRTDNYVRIQTRFHNLKDTQKRFRFSHITLVNSSGRRVRPINIKGVNWSFSSGSIESNNLPNQISEIDLLFPSLNLFTTNQYKLYITLNNKSYLIQI